MDILAGKKTYVAAGAIFAATVAKSAGWIDEAVYEAIMGLLAALGLGALRAGVSKANE